MSIKKILLAAILAGPVSAIAGDLVLKLGTSNDPRIPITGLVTVNPSSGDVIVDPIANSGAANDGWCPSGGTSPTAPTFTTTFSASPTSLPVGGGSVTLTWATANATSCTASSSPSVSGWSGTVGTSGPSSVTLTASGTYTLSLYCSGSGGNTSNYSRQVVVATETAPNECTNRPHPTGLSRQTTFYNGGLNSHNANDDIAPGNVSVLYYTNVLGNFVGASQYANEDAYLPIDVAKFMALEFTTTGVADGTYGRISWEQPTSNGAPLTVMVSPCPGDFQFVTAAKCKVTLGYGNITWFVTNGTNPSSTCKLEPNKTYYVNAAFVESSDYVTNSCPSGKPSCNWFVSNQRLSP